MRRFRVLIALLLLSVAVVATTTVAEDVISLNSFADQEGDLVSAVAVLSTTAVAPGETARAAVRIDIANGWHINSAHPYQDYLIAADVAVDTVVPVTPHDVTYPAGHDAMLGDQSMSVYSGQVVIPFEVSVQAGAAAGTYTLPVHVSFQPCNDRECRAPQTLDLTLEIPAGPGGTPAHTDVFANLPAATHPEPTPATAVQPPSELDQLIAEHGFLGYLIVLGLAFVTGLLLSFSPCTYPMIPITVSIFAGQDRTVGRGFFLSLIYVGTMAVMYGVMGLIVSLVGGVFGAWLASPPVVIAIAVVFVIFSLSMFGLYELNVPMALRQKLGTAKTGGGVVGALLLGVIAALVVSPCVGPFVAGILLYIATSGSPVIGFLVLFVFALGLGTLFVLIGTFSTAINKLPRSGEWMEQVKKFFGFVLLLMAIYFLRTIVPTEVTAVIAALLLLALGVFGGGLDRLTPESGFFLRLKKFIGVLALLIGTYLLLVSLLTSGLILPPSSQWMGAPGNQTAMREDLIQWRTDLESGLSEAAEQGRPVLIDTWATWCTNCKVLEKKTFHHPDVVAESRHFVPIKVQLEAPDSPETKAFMKRFGLKTYSLPTTVLLNGKGEVKRIMPGVVNPPDMIAEMRKVE